MESATNLTLASARAKLAPPVWELEKPPLHLPPAAPDTEPLNIIPSVPLGSRGKFNGVEQDRKEEVNRFPFDQILD